MHISYFIFAKHLAAVIIVKNLLYYTKDLLDLDTMNLLSSTGSLLDLIFHQRLEPIRFLYLRHLESRLRLRTCLLEDPLLYQMVNSGEWDSHSCNTRRLEHQIVAVRFMITFS